MEFIILENLPFFFFSEKSEVLEITCIKMQVAKSHLIFCIGTLCQCIHVFISFLSSNLTCLFAICFYLYFSILGHIGTFGQQWQNIPRCCEISPIRGPAYFRVCLAFRPKWCLNTIVSTSLVFCSHFVTEKYICQISFQHSEIVPELNNSSRVLNRN